jgi:hypothetical protein
VAERIDGGAEAAPGKYASGALAGIANLKPHVGVLSEREKALRWEPGEVKPARQAAKKAFSIRAKLLSLIGGG